MLKISNLIGAILNQAQNRQQTGRNEMVSASTFCSKYTITGFWDALFSYFVQELNLFWSKRCGAGTLKPKSKRNSGL